MLMKSEELLDLTGLTKLGEGAYERRVGTLFGYPVEATVPKNEKHLTLTFTVAKHGFKIKELKKILESNPELNDSVDIKTPSAEEGRFNVFLVNIKTAEADIMKDRYTLVLHSLEEALKELPAFAPPTNCGMCSEGKCDTLVNYDGSLNVFHKACLDKHKEEMEQKFEDKASNPNLFGGFIGGLIGGIVGAIPTLIALVFFNYLIGLLFALIPLGTFYGWKLAGGKLIKLTAVFTIIYTIVVALLTWTLAIGIELRNLLAEFGEHVTIMESIQILFEVFAEEPDVFREYFMFDTLIAFAFAIIGIVIVWRQITKTDEEVLALTSAVVDEAIPLDKH
jgi:hypothetical protein